MTVTMSCEAMSPKEADAVRRARVQIDVTDTGIGIQARKLPLLFKKFSQLDSSTTRYVPIGIYPQAFLFSYS